jgi:hypothetical protein
MQTLELSPTHTLLLDDEWAHLLALSPRLVARTKQGFEPHWYVNVGAIPVHRLIMGVEGIPATAVMVDHIDGDGMNNQRGNLRLATPTQNALNRRKYRNNTSGVKGVSWSEKEQRFQAYLKVNGRQKKLGRYKELVDAEAAVRAARELHHGRFANHG